MNKTPLKSPQGDNPLGFVIAKRSRSQNQEGIKEHNT